MLFVLLIYFIYYIIIILPYIIVDIAYEGSDNIIFNINKRIETYSWIRALNEIIVITILLIC